MKKAGTFDLSFFDLQSNKDSAMYQPDVKGLQLPVFTVQRNHFEEPVIQTQTNDAALRVEDTDDPGL